MANFSVESSESENDEDSGVAADEVVATEAAKGSAMANGSVANAVKAAGATAGETATKKAAAGPPEEATTGRSTEKANADAGLDAEETGLDGATWKVFARPKSGHLFWKRV